MSEKQESEMEMASGKREGVERFINAEGWRKEMWGNENELERTYLHIERT